MIKYKCKRREEWLWLSSLNAREEENGYDDQVYKQEKRRMVMIIKYKCKRRGEWLWLSSINAREENNLFWWASRQ